MYLHYYNNNAMIFLQFINKMLKNYTCCGKKNDHFFCIYLSVCDIKVFVYIIQIFYLSDLLFFF